MVVFSISFLACFPQIVHYLAHVQPLTQAPVVHTALLMRKDPPLQFGNDLFMAGHQSHQVDQLQSEVAGGLAAFEEHAVEEALAQFEDAQENQREMQREQEDEGYFRGVHLKEVLEHGHGVDVGQTEVHDHEAVVEPAAVEGHGPEVHGGGCQLQEGCHT